MEYLYPTLITFLLINLAVGLYYGRGVKTFREYAVGRGNFSIILLAATISATRATGSSFNFFLSDAYGDGLLFLPFLFSILGLWLVGKLAIRMGEFFGSLSIAEALGKLYGKPVRFLTALCGIIMYLGWVALQFRVSANIFASVFELDKITATLLVGSVIIIYSALGGMRSIVFTDLLQFLIFFVLLPIFIFVVWYRLRDDISAGSIIQEKLGGLWHKLATQPKKVNFVWADCLNTIFMVFQPALFQRMLAANNPHKAKRSFNNAAVFWFFIGFMYLVIGVLIWAVDRNVKGIGEDDLFLLKYVVGFYKDKSAFLGLLLIGISAMVMSSADSFINSASVLFTNDIAGVWGPLPKRKLFTARIFALLIGSSALVLSFVDYDFWKILKFYNAIYMSTVIAPLVLAALGFRSRTLVVLISMGIGPLSALIWKFTFEVNTGIGSDAFGLLVSFFTLLTTHYALGEPGGWVGIKDVGPLTAERQLRRRSYNRLQASIHEFNPSSYLQKNLPKQEYLYGALGAYVIAFVFGSCFFIPNITSQNTLVSFVLISALVVNSLAMAYPIWPQEIKKKHVIAPFWCFAVGYALCYLSSFLLLLGGFHLVHIALMITNLVIAGLLLRRNLVIFLLGVGSLLGFITHRALGSTVVIVNTTTTPMGLCFVGVMAACALFALFQSEAGKAVLEQRQVTLRGFQKSAEEALFEMKAAPAFFARRIKKTDTAGVRSAYALSHSLKEKLGNEKVSKEVRKIADKLHTQIEKSAQYLEKIIYAIETQTQLQKLTIPLNEFLDQLYDQSPNLEEGALLLHNRARRKNIQCDVVKIHRLLQDIYGQMQLDAPGEHYFYLHVRDTKLRYPNHKRSIPAFAFLFTKKEKAAVNIASSYTHLDKIPVDPHLAGNRFLKEAQVVVDKHYGYFNLTDIPHQYLVVLPARLDDIRPKIIEDQKAPNRSLDSELMREAKRTEADFWRTVAEEKRYDILEIERVVNFMKATHRHQTRKSGHPYYMHTLTVAKYASEHSKAPHVIVAALLHDIAEDTNVSLEEIGVRFGTKVADLVKLLSNIKSAFKKYKIDSKADHVTLLAKNKEATLIKACDRLHNLQTLGNMPRHKQKAKAEETLKYYIPVMRDAGLDKLADQIEALAKKFL